MKIAINKKLTVCLSALIWSLVGCQSEVDKCVNSFMKRDEPYANEKERNESEARFRLGCLKASRGN